MNKDNQNNSEKEKETKKLIPSPMDNYVALRGKCEHLGTLIKTFDLELTL